MNRREFLKKTASIALPLLSTSCIIRQRGLITEPSCSRWPVHLESPENIKGNKPKRATQDDLRYGLERVVINSHDLYVQQNINRQEGEADFYFIRFEDHTKIRDKNQKLIALTSKVIYIPTKVTDQDPERITYTTQGEFGKRAQITRYDVSSVETGIIRETEKDTRYKIGTEVVAGREWYVPRVRKEKMSETHALPFHMMHQQTSLEETDANGIISIVNKNGYFRPLKVTREDYEKRSPSIPSSQSTTGQQAPSTAPVTPTPSPSPPAPTPGQAGRTGVY